MGIAIGIDAAEVERMTSFLRRGPRLLRRVFTEEECRYCEQSARPAEHFAARFAAKEAFLKALGLRLGALPLGQIEIVREHAGRPRIRLGTRARDTLTSRGFSRAQVSLSHTRAVAVAVVVLD
jgi:holo-[acyl-carrier protein] synthase